MEPKKKKADHPKKPSKKPQKASEPPVTRLLAKRSMMRGQRGSRPAPTLPELRRDRDRRRAVLASFRAADDVLEADLQSDEILACFEEALGERQPEMGTDAAAGREANAESKPLRGKRVPFWTRPTPREPSRPCSGGLASGAAPRYKPRAEPIHRGLSGYFSLRCAAPQCAI